MGIVASSPVAHLTGAVRRLGRSPLVAPWLIGAYRAACLGGARYLEGLGPVQAVLVAGSMARVTHVVPGVSDIDLVLVAELPTNEAELGFRAALAARHRRLHSLVPAFHSLEYFDRQDVPCLTLFANGWVDLEGGWRLVGGAALPILRHRRPAHELRLTRLFQAIRAWRKSACHLLDPRLDVEGWVLQRTAERLLAVTLAMWLDRDRYEPFAQLLEASAERGLHVDTGKRGPSRDWVRACLASTLDALDRLADASTVNWKEPLVSTPGAFAGPSADSEAWARALVASGFASAIAVPSPSAARAHRLLALAAPGQAPLEVIERAEHAFRSLPAVTRADRFPDRPIVVTPAVWRAAALLEPSPWLAAAIAGGDAHSYGAEPPPVVAPPPEELRSLLALRSVELFYRARGRHFRIGKPDADARFAADLTLAAFLARAADAGELVLRRAPAPSGDAAGIAELRAFVASRRRALEPELEARAVSARAAS